MPFKCNKLLLTACFANVLEILSSICHVAHDVSMLQEELVHDTSADFFQRLVSALEKHWVTIKNEATLRSVYGLRSSEGKYL